jgi:hypothetical protein
MDRLNYFNPYNDKSDNHEDRFTRAFMAVIALSPLVATYFYDSLRGAAGDSELVPTHRFSPSSMETGTQWSSLPVADRYYSVLISDDVYEGNVQVTPADRKARYDGVLRSGDTVFFIEVKPFSSDVWEGQLSPSATDIPEEAYLHPTPLCLSTRDIITFLNELREHTGISFTEAKLIDDFLAFVNDKFAELNPYDSYKQSLTYQLAQRRTAEVLGQVASSEELVRYHRGWGHYINIEDMPEIRKIGLLVEKDQSGDGWTGLLIAADFGSTQGQAKAFYRNPAVTLEAVNQVQSASAAGNLHLAKITSNVIHFETAAKQFDSYFRHWKDFGPQLSQMKRVDFKNQYGQWKDEKLVVAQDSNFSAKVMDAAYQNLNVCPAVYFTRFIGREEVLRLEAEGNLLEEITQTMREILNILGRDFTLI